MSEPEGAEIDRSTAWKWFVLGFEASAEGFNAELLNDRETMIQDDFEEAWNDE